MKNIAFKKAAVLFFVIIFSCLLSAGQDKLEKIDAYIKQAMIDWEMPGFALAVVHEDSVIFAKGYGTKEFGENDPVDASTQFVIASCSKAFTTASLAVLVDQGRIGWDDKVIKYLPYFQMYDPWVTHEMTIRDLVTHRSGLETFSGDIMWINSTYDRNEIIKRARHLKSVTGFRYRYGYQNIMYITAAEIVKAVTDTVWNEFVRHHFLKPLGMENTSTTYAEMLQSENYSKSHYKKDGQTRIYSDTQTDNAGGAIGLNASVKDMAQWIKLQLGQGNYRGQQLISKSQWNEMTRNQMAVGSSNYGLGWFISYREGRRIIAHGGGMPGMISRVAIVPEENLGIVLMSNADESFVSAAANYILDLFFDLEPKDYSREALENLEKRKERINAEQQKRESGRIKNTKPSLPLEKYCGLYEDQMYGNAAITLEKRRLFMQFIPNPSFRGELKHFHLDVFYIDWEDEFLTRGYVKFDFNFDGTIKDFEIEVPHSPDFIFTELLFKKK